MAPCMWLRISVNFLWTVAKEGQVNGSSSIARTIVAFFVVGEFVFGFEVKTERKMRICQW